MSVGCTGGDIEYNLKIDVSKTAEELLKFQTLLYGTLGILHRLGLPEPIDDAITKIQRMIAVVNMLRLAFISMYTAAGPAGWAIAGIGIAGTVLTAGSLVESMQGY